MVVARRSSSAFCRVGADTLIVTTAENSRPAAAAMSPEMFSIVSVAPEGSVALK